MSCWACLRVCCVRLQLPAVQDFMFSRLIAGCCLLVLKMSRSLVIAGWFAARVLNCSKFGDVFYVAEHTPDGATWRFNLHVFWATLPLSCGSDSSRIDPKTIYKFWKLILICIAAYIRHPIYISALKWFSKIHSFAFFYTFHFCSFRIFILFIPVASSIKGLVRET